MTISPLFIAVTLRGLRKHPAFTLTAAGALAVGIGLAVGLASVADAILLRPLPVPRPQEMVRVYTASKTHSMGYVSYPDYQDFARATHTVSGLIAQTQILAAVGGERNEAPRVRLGLAVSANYFDVLGIHAARGRLFTPDDARANSAVLSHAFWMAQYRGDPNVIGRVIEIKNSPYTVTGVAPANFGLDRFLHEDFYVPVEAYAEDLGKKETLLDNRANRFLAVYARTQQPTQTAAELAALARRLESEYPESNREHRVLVLTEFQARLHENGSMPILAAGLLVLAALAYAAACASVSGMILLRREEQAEEIALRIALGARTLQLWSEAMAESLTLALLGCAGGFAFALAVTKLLARAVTMPTDLNMGFDARIDPRITVFGLAIAIAGAVILGSAAAGRGSKRINGAGSSRVTRNSRLRGRLAVLQVALASALVATGALYMHDIALARLVDLGYRVDHVLLMTFDPSQTLAQTPNAGETKARAFYKELLDRESHLPGVISAALAQSVPLGVTAAQKQVSMIGEANLHAGIWVNTVTPSYFELMRMPILAGRPFDDGDIAVTTPVAIVNEEMSKLWQGGAIGRVMNVDGHTVTVVGVARNAKYSQINESPLSFFYLPFSQNYVSRMTLHLKTAAPPSAIAGAAVAEARAVDPAQSVSEIRALETYLNQGALFAARAGVTVAFLAGLPVLVLALTGLFATVSAAMRARQREIGIRVAVGANQVSVMGLGLRQALPLVIRGIALGAITAALFRSLLAQISLKEYVGHAATRDIPILGFALLLVTGVSLLACLLPLWKAARLDPAMALRDAQ